MTTQVDINAIAAIAALLPDDKIILSRTGSAKTMTGSNFVSSIVGSLVGAGAMYATAAAAQGDAALAAGKMYLLVPGTHAGAFDIMVKDSGAASTYVSTGTNQTLVDSSVDAAKILLAKRDMRDHRLIPTETKPVIAHYMLPNVWVVRTKMVAGAGFTINRQDFMETYLVNANANIATCWAVVGQRAFVGGAFHELSTFIHEETVNGTPDNGLSYSTHEFAIRPFITGKTPDGTTAPIRGPFHGGMIFIPAGSSMRMDGGADQLAVPPPVGTILYGSSFTLDQVFNVMAYDAPNPDKVASRSTMNHVFNATDQCIILITHDHAHAAVNCVPRWWHGYTSMIVTRTANTVKPISPGTAITLNNAVGTQTNLGKRSVIALYHTNHPNVILEKYQRYGFPDRINGVNDDYANANDVGGGLGNYVFILEQNGYAKVYDYPFSFVGTNSLDMTGKVVTTNTRYTIRLATAA